MPKPYLVKPPKELITVGDHIRKKRIELDLMQKDVGEEIGVTEECIGLWERSIVEPTVEYFPLIIKFLGYFPWDIETDTLPGKIKRYRYMHGLSSKALGDILNVHPTTAWAWEKEGTIPWRKTLKRLNEMLSS